MTKLDICNMALTRCGAELITSLDDTSKRAKLVLNQYEPTLKECLNDSTWNFAIKRATLEQIDEVSLGLPYQYEKPEDCIRILELQSGVTYKVEGDYIYSDCNTSIDIRYLAYIENAEKFNPSFVKALALKLAEDISYALVQSASLQQAITSEAERYLRRARSYNSQEGTPEGRYPDEYTTSIRL